MPDEPSQDPTIHEADPSAPTVAVPTTGDRSPTVGVDPPRPSAGPAGERIGRYTVTEHLGAGGMGDVFGVRDDELGREVAVKVLRAGDERARRKFAFEARLTGRLEHPGIPPVHELGRDGGRDFFTMKRVEGRTLGELIVGRTPLRALLAAFVRVCEAVAFAHDRRVLHRDLKPANIMVGAYGEVLVMDWGLARQLDDGDADEAAAALTPDTDAPRDAGDPLRTLDGSVLGTPAYMPPEQAAGRISELDERSDIYALGAILYEMLTRKAPYDGVSSWATLARVSEGPPPPPSQVVDADVPRELEAVVARAMARRREDRYPTCDALRADVQAYLDGGTLAAARYSPVQRLAKWVRRHRAPVAAAAVVGLLALGLAGGQALAARRAHQQRVAGAQAEAERTWTSLKSAAELRAALEEARAAESEEARLAIARPWREELARTIAAVDATDRWIAIAGPTPARLRRRQAVGLALGKVALLCGDYELARYAFEALTAHGAREAAVARLVRGVDQERVRLVEARRAQRAARIARQASALREILAQLAVGGAARGESWYIDDKVHRALAWREPETVALLEREVLRPMVTQARTAGSGSGSESEAGSAASPVWTQAQRDQATFACRVLGRLGLPGCVEALAEFAEAIRDPDLLREAGLALCFTERVEAYEPVLALKRALGEHTPVWHQISRAFPRVPEPGGKPAEQMTVADYLRRAQARIDRERYDQALPDIAEVLRRDPVNANALFLRGNVKLMRRDYAGAQADYEASLAAEENETARINLAVVKLRRHRLGEAAAEIDRVLKRFPRSALAHGTRAWIRIHQHDFAGARDDAQQALKGQSRSAELHHRHAIALWFLGERSRAMAAVERAIECDPGRLLSRVLRARFHHYRGDVARALAEVNAVLQLSPRMLDALTLRARIRINEGNLAIARADLERARAIDPDDGLVVATLARLLAIEGKRSDAIAAAQRLPALFTPAEGLWRRAQIYELVGEGPKARADLDAALKLIPNYVAALVLRARVRGRAIDFEGALADVQQANRLRSSVEQQVLEAQLLTKLGRFDEAQKLAERARRTDARNPDTHLAIADIAIRRRRYADAMAAVDRAAAVAPRSATPYYYRGMIRFLQKDYSRARHECDQAIRLDPRKAEAYMLRSQVRLALGDVQRAMADVGKALQLDPDLRRSMMKKPKKDK